MYRSECKSWCYDQPMRGDNYRESNYKEAGRKDYDNDSCQQQWDKSPCYDCHSCPWYFCCNSPWSPGPPNWDKCDKHEKDKCDKHKRKEESENEIDATTTVNICQNANASGGNGGSGGDGGDAYGGSAAAASAESEGGEGDASASATVCENGPDAVQTLRKAMANPNLSEQDLQSLQELLDLQLGASVAIGDAAAAGGNATGGNGGNGGAGGAGGAITQTASVTVENYVIINAADNLTTPPKMKLGINGKHVEVTMDENGNTFVNGQKMDEQQLDNGTKVFIFRNNEVKKSE